MMIDHKKDIWIVDWEFAGFGHSLADIGQFFRESDRFDEVQKKVFEVAYNRIAKRRLPKYWYQLSKLRDLVNPLQMIGASEENYPIKYADFNKQIQQTLAYLGY